MGPWAMLMTRITPKMSARPSATMAYSEPARIPEMMTCPIIAGVMAGVICIGGLASGSCRGWPERDGRWLRCAAEKGPSRPLLRGARWLPCVPGRRGEPRLAARELVRPHGHLLAVLPLEQDHLVRRLEARVVHLVLAEGRLRLQLEQRLAHLVGVQRARALDGLGVDH